MSKFIKVGHKNNEIIININDIVNVQKETNSYITICYRTINDLGEPIITGISTYMSEELYKRLMEDLNPKQY